MIQRIQSLLLFVAAVFHVMFFFVNLWEADVRLTGEPDKIIKMSVYQIVTSSKVDGAVIKIEDQIIPLLINILLIALSLVTIFLFKNRMLQNKFCRLLILFEAGLIVFLFFAFDKVKSSIVATSFTDKIHYAQIAIPVVALILIFIAGKAIMKDENKVRSVDRIR